MALGKRTSAAFVLCVGVAAHRVALAQIGDLITIDDVQAEISDGYGGIAS